MATPALSGLADALLGAMRTGALVELPEDLDEDDGYRIADMIARARVDAGDEIIGWKIGAALDSVQAQLGLTRPIVLPVHTSSLGPPSFALLHQAAYEIEAVQEVDAARRPVATFVGIELMSLRHVADSFHGPWLVADQGVHTAGAVGDRLDFDDEVSVTLDAPGDVHLAGAFRRTWMPPDRLADLLGDIRAGRPAAAGDLVWTGLQLGPGDVLEPGTAVVDASGRRATMQIVG